MALIDLNHAQNSAASNQELLASNLPPQKTNRKPKKTSLSSFSCIYCNSNKIYLYKRSFNKHLTNFHTNEIIIRCKFDLKCGLIFKTEQEMEIHIKAIHENVGSNRKIECIYCGRWIVSRGINRHMKQHKDLIIKCDFDKKCLSFFHNQIDKKRHIDNEHLATKSQDNECIAASSSEDLDAHISQTHVDVKINCAVAARSERTTHCDENHQGEEILKNFQCRNCSYRASSQDHLTNHIAGMHQSSKFKCSGFECTSEFKSELSLKYHLTFLCTASSH